MGNVCNVPNSVRGPSLEDVRMSRVRAASMGASTTADKAAAAVLSKMVAIGVVDERIEVSGTAPPAEAERMSFSATANTAARKPLKNVSNVRVRMLYTKVEFVALHIAKPPSFDDRAERASSSEWGFLRCIRPSDF